MSRSLRFWSILFLALLLAQVPVTVRWSLAQDDGPQTVMAAGAAACHHPDVDTENAACGDRGCVYCGFAAYPVALCVTAYIAALLGVPDVADLAPPRFEQPVELRPPKPTHLA